ncbi:BTAD domain-containing putative transcriptional regulator [Acrocarpospora phusangensis]|uniref:BTAD domain-containing putative transcriptional regulator n=1 Tax=Acrocarpospora phusangensis TaxID=1070424 RepID=UPI001950A42B|nr:BTAD domain-containing putative transcriptional regulator [Acrocarpospora phusangensis]
MEFRVLGPIAVIGADGGPLDIGPAQQRAVLALCLLAAPRPMSVSRLIDALWEDGAPAGAVNTVQAYVSKLRRVLEPGRARRGAASILVSRPGGYALDIPDEVVDRRRVTARAAEGRRLLAAGDPAKAVRELRLALSEWRGEPLAGFEDQSWAKDERLALTELRLSLVEDAAEADLALARGSDLVPDLTLLVSAHPLRERLRRLAAHALYQSGRQADALATLAEGRRLLVDDLGLDPDPRSRDLESRILSQDPALTPVPLSPATPTPAPTVVLGRTTETATLHRAITTPGHRVVLISGEPGIGKTSLVESAALQREPGSLGDAVPPSRQRDEPGLSGYAGRGADSRVVFGRCWDGGGAPPFWPWVQVVRALTGQAGELAEITGATGEFPMFEAVARLLNAGPVLVVLDDLQWADASSLRLLDFLASTRPCPELTVLATYRDTEVSEPLARTLATLSRLPHVERVTLGGLSEDAVAEYLERSGADPARAAEELRRTGGNPFFLSLGEEAPGAVADVLRGRLAAMPPGAHDVLSAAALIGREAELGVLLDVLDLPQDDVLDVLDEAVRSRLLTERSLVYAFSHDIVRDVLRDGLAPLRRRRLHARVAAVLEGRGTHLAELAYHYREGLVIAGMAARAIEYARQAARHATEQFAYEDAAGHLEQAVALTGQLPVTDLELKCDLLLELAEAQSVAGMNSRVHATLDEAAALADRLGDDERLAKAALGFSDPLGWAMYEEWAASEALLGRIDRALAQAGERWRSPLLAASAIMGSFIRPPGESRELAARAVREARDDRSRLRALSAVEILSRGIAGAAERRELVARMAESAAATGDLVDEWLAGEARYVEMVSSGEFTAAGPLLDWLRQTARRLRQPSLIGLAEWQAAIRAYLAGDLDTAIAEAEEAARAHPEGALGGDGAQLRALLMRAQTARLRGDLHTALTIADNVLETRPGQPVWTVLRCHTLLDLGRHDEAAAIFTTLAQDGFATIASDLTYRFIPDSLSRICATLRNPQAAEALYTHFHPNSGRLLGWSITDLCLSHLARTLNRPTTATHHLTAAHHFLTTSGLPALTE